MTTCLPVTLALLAIAAAFAAGIVTGALALSVTGRPVRSTQLTRPPGRHRARTIR